MAKNDGSTPFGEAISYGRKQAENLFANRKGHGGARISERHLSQAQVAAIMAIAYEAGFNAAASLALSHYRGRQ